MRETRDEDDSTGRGERETKQNRARSSRAAQYRRINIVRMPSMSAVEPGKRERLYTANKAEQRIDRAATVKKDEAKDGRRNAQN